MNEDKKVVIAQLTEAISHIDFQEQVERVKLGQAEPDEYEACYKRIYAQQYASNYLRKLRNLLDTTYAPLNDYVITIRETDHRLG
jgi:hypothetical protein